MDAVLGSSVALAAITMAHASLPRAADLPRLVRPPSAQPVPAPAVAGVAPPAALIAFRDPVPGHGIDSPFGLRKLPWEAHGRLHAGVDIAGDSGEAILAVADGVVVGAGQGGAYGRYVEVRHATGLASFYAHMGAIAPGVAPGVALKAGTPVGRMGSTGTSTGPHLHLEIRDDQERPLNPQLFLGRAFAREGDLPMRNAARVPRGVRVAYVSQIPASKRAVMAAKAEAEAAAEASEELAGPRRLTPDARRALIKTLAAAEKAQPAPPVKLQIPPAPSAADAAINGRVTTGADGRPHITLNL